jgi:type I restriction enzyme, S subunit
VNPGYKQTDLGVIPEEWQTRKIREIGDVRGRVGWKGYTKKDLVPSGPYTIGAKHIDNQCKLDLSEPTYLSRAKYLESPEIMIQMGDILIVQRGTIGKLVLIEEDIGEATINPSMVIIRTTNSSPSFIRYFLLSSQGQKQITLDTSTTGVPMISQKQIENFRIAFPPLPEQRAIAKALSDVDALLELLDRLIAKKRDLKQAAMQQLLTGQTRLPGFHGEWEEKSLFALADEKKELFDDGDWIEAEFLTESGIRLVQTGNIGEGQFNDKEVKKYISPESFKKLQCKALQIGDILICRLAEPAGRACILPNIGEERAITAVDVTIFRPRASMADRRFLVNLFNTRRWFDDVNERCGGSTRTRIARGELGKIKVTLPPVLEQTAIADVLTDMDAELAALEQRREKTRDLKQAMMQEFLTGKTRLI